MIPQKITYYLGRVVVSSILQYQFEETMSPENRLFSLRNSKAIHLAKRSRVFHNTKKNQQSYKK